MSNTNNVLEKKLIFLAQKYESHTFLEKDPSQFMHRYKNKEDQEIVAFISANLAFGRRDQILKHIEIILKEAGPSPCKWILNRGYEKAFAPKDTSFYRMYTYRHMNIFFTKLRDILLEDKSLGNHYKKLYQKDTLLCFIISADFPKECALIPHSKDSACKKLNMFLRWMVRDNSPVDLGLWSNWYSKEKLLIPMDTHVISEAANMGLLPLTKSGKPCSSNIKVCQKLTDKMKEIFPGDPCKADYALFGLGVDENKN